jgi:hypothetical protein
MESMAARSERCWHCGRAVDGSDRFCRGCGEGQGAALAWYYRPLWIAVLALTALGPFAVVLIMRTPRLGRAAKWLASLALVGISAYVVWELRAALDAMLEL